MFQAVQPLLFDGSDYLATANQNCSRIVEDAWTDNWQPRIG
jgi:hypothetical protein